MIINVPIFKHRFNQCFWVYLILFSSLIIYFFTAYRLASTNQDTTNWDQDCHLVLAQTANQSPLHYAYDGARMPLFTALLSTITNPDFLIFFTKAKLFTIILSLVYLTILFLIFRKYLSLLNSLIMILITALTAWLAKSVIVWPELTYYFLFFLSYLLLSSLLLKPSKKIALLTGVVSALAYLSKASLPPLIIIFSLFFILKYKIQSLVYLLILYLSFSALMAPHWLLTYKTFGQPFYNVEHFYFWYDSWNEVKTGTKAYDDRSHFPDMPKDELPSLIKYVKKHNFPQAVFRIYWGFKETVKYILISKENYGWHWYLIGYTLVTGSLIIRQFKLFVSLLKQYRFNILFLITFIITYILLISWYGYLGVSDHYILSLFLPFFFSLFILNQKLHQQPYFRYFNLLVLAILIIQIILTPFLRVSMYS